MLTFGLAACNVETLGWTVQLITVQGMLFFLAAGCWLSAQRNGTPWTPGSTAILAGLVTCSTFSFVRGALTGIALAAALGLAVVFDPSERAGWRHQFRLGLVCLIPALALAVLLGVFAPGNHHRLAEAGFLAPLNFAAWYFLLNPFHRLVDVSTWGPHTLVVIGGIKIVVLIQGWRLASRAQRQLLLPILLFELGNTALLGIGRYHTGLLAATSSRYQYIALICTLPFAGVCLEAVLRTLAAHPLTRIAVGTGVVIFCGVGAGINWPATLRIWSEERGRVPRQALLVDPHPPETGVVPGIDSIPTRRAKELIREFHLH
jgi:hypothetical protein